LNKKQVWKQIKKCLVMAVLIVPLACSTLIKTTAPIRSVSEQQPQSKIKLQGKLSMIVNRANGEVETIGPINNLIVNTGEDFMVDVFQASTNALSTLRYHGVGDGSAAAAETDTALGSAFTTELSTDNIRCTGTQGQNGSNVYQTVCTNTFDASVTVKEFGLFSNATVGSGVMWSRILTGDITLASSDTIQTTYELTVE